ncbi:MAG: DsbA family protein [Candidatus Liptonbacteria bacterium]|nr:DsbA family protein [Candidatus Liptonbacteria bacterium]
MASYSGSGGGGKGGATLLADPVSVGDWKKGNVEAKVELLEYGDYQCPACGAYYPMVEKLIKDLGDKFSFVYRQFPLREIHKNAEAAAEAAEAAGKQNKFWEMHDWLYKNQELWAETSNAKERFADAAASFGLDRAQFEKDRNAREIAAKVQKDFDGGVKAGINGTPSFYLNGEKIQNPASYDEFKNLILSKVPSATANGTKP